MDQLLAKDMLQLQIDLAKLINSYKKVTTVQHSKRHQTNTIWRVTKKLTKLNKDTSNNKWKDKTKELMKMDKSCFPLKITNLTYKLLEMERGSSFRLNNNKLLKLIEPRILKRWGNCSIFVVEEIILLILREMVMSSVMVLELSAQLDMVGQRRCSHL